MYAGRMEIRALRPDEVKNYLSTYYSYLKIEQPEEYASSKLKGYTTEDLQEVADMFTVASSSAGFVAGVCLY